VLTPLPLTCGFCRPSARARAEALVVPSALPRRECLAARLAMTLVHSGTLIRRLLKAQSLLALDAAASGAALSGLVVRGSLSRALRFWRAAHAGDERASGICLSSTGRSSGAAQTWRRSPGMLSVAGWHAAAATKRAPSIFASSIGHPSGSAQTWCHTPGIGCRRCRSGPPGGPPPGGCCVRWRVAVADVGQSP
jgi:hypothetical protein